jgi:ABC-type amino acid transport substrate-binding protein
MSYRTLLCLALALGIAGLAHAQSGVLDKVRRTGMITIGYVENSTPFSFTDAQKTPQGYSVELCRQVASGIRTQLGIAALETRWVVLTLQDRLAAVRDGRVDMECSTTTWTLTRQQEVDFSLITFVDGGSIMSRVDKELRRLADFKGKRIAVITGTTTDKALRDALAQRSVAAQLVMVKARDEGMKLLAEGKVDGFASDRIVLLGLVMGNKNEATYAMLDEDFSVEPYAFALPRGDHDFRLAVNRVLAGLYRGGGIEKVYKQWLGVLGPPSLLLSALYFIQAIPE